MPMMYNIRHHLYYIRMTIIFTGLSQWADEYLSNNRVVYEKN